MSPSRACSSHSWSWRIFSSAWPFPLSSVIQNRLENWKNKHLFVPRIFLTFFPAFWLELVLYSLLFSCFSVANMHFSWNVWFSWSEVSKIKKKNCFELKYIFINPKRCGLFGQLRRRGGPKVPSERWRSLDASIFIQTQQTVPHMKADIFS